MGREIVRVPPGFQHPTDEEGYPVPGAHLEPLYYTEAARLTAYQIYENTSEGTPVSPIFNTATELVSWLVTQGVPKESAEAFISQGHAPLLVVSGDSKKEKQ